MTDDFLKIEVNENSFPWIKDRKHPNVIPKYKIVSRSMTKSYNSIVMIHTAGTGYVKNYYMKELLQNEEMLKDMLPNEIKLMKWIVESEKNDPLLNLKNNKQSQEN